MELIRQKKKEVRLNLKKNIYQEEKVLNFLRLCKKVQKKGETKTTIDLSDEKITCSGYPYESVVTIEGWGSNSYYVYIDDYVFALEGVSTKFATFKSIYAVYIKAGTAPVKADAEKKEKKTKKKNSFFAKMKALKKEALGSVGVFGPEYKEFKKKDFR
ncbi:hypothetical protein [Polaribacter atrinae]|uniref:hypothetical protein n=1 Tax=Polaribacter atrinae TaxID=1333662 RepID=UPI0030FC88A1